MSLGRYPSENKSIAMADEEPTYLLCLVLEHVCSRALLEGCGVEFKSVCCESLLVEIVFARGPVTKQPSTAVSPGSDLLG